MEAGPKHVAIRTDADIVEARIVARQLASELGFTPTDLVLIATAVSEIARNIVEYAGEGEVVVSPFGNTLKTGILIIAKDTGPGIADVSRSLEEGYSTGRGLGLGLPGARRLMDEFEIASELGKGTVVRMKKWLR